MQAQNPAAVGLMVRFTSEMGHIFILITFYSEVFTLTNHFRECICAHNSVQDYCSTFFF